MANQRIKNPRPARLKVGQRVLVHMAGGRKVRAILIEDRGTIGIGGRRLWRIRETGPADAQDPPREYEVPAVELTPLAEPRTTPRPRRASRPAVPSSVR